MTLLEYLYFLSSHKGFLFIDESRLKDVLEEDKRDLFRLGYIRIEGEPGCEIVTITPRGERFIMSVE